MQTHQLKSLVQRTRRGEYADWEGVISSFPLANCDDLDERLFLQFNTSVNIDQKLQKLVGFGHPDLIHNLKYGPVHLFVDCTFSCVPKGFSQCLIMMAHDKSTSMYVPTFYVLMQTKKEVAYKHAFRMCAAATDDTMDIITATCDFERGMINALKDKFKKPIIGCEFHWKQAIRRKLLELNVSREKISTLVDATGLLNLLTVIPIDEIENKGIPYIREHFNEGQDKPKFDTFWKYFVSTWMTQYNPEDWNVHGRNNVDATSDGFILNRTNNPLERFNRKLNGCFPNRHPTVVQFVMGIKKLSLSYVQELSNIRRGHSRPPVHQPATSHPIPSDYASFKSDVTLRRSLYGQIYEFRFLEGTCHYDDDDAMMYKITRVQWWEKRRDERYIVAHRIQCKYQHGYVIEAPQEDFISIEEAMEYTGIVPKPKEDSNKNTLSDGSYQVTSSSVPQQQMVEAPQTIGRVHCVCVKRSNGQFCLAKLQQASPSAKRHPNAMYWSCSKRTVSGID
jgi:hypothetical protein